VLVLISDMGIVHGNLRPWNIFVRQQADSKNGRLSLQSVRLFGFENWFYFKDFQKAMPGLVSEYTPPEILNYLL
jgi:hypothetical protein